MTKEEKEYYTINVNGTHVELNIDHQSFLLEKEIENTEQLTIVSAKWKAEQLNTAMERLIAKVKADVVKEFLRSVTVYRNED